MDQLYSFRECYFETHGVEDAGRKQRDVREEMEKTLQRMEEVVGMRGKEPVTPALRQNAGVCSFSVDPLVSHSWETLPWRLSRAHPPSAPVAGCLWVLQRHCLKFDDSNGMK